MINTILNNSEKNSGMLVSQSRITWADMLVGSKYVKQLTKIVGQASILIVIQLEQVDRYVGQSNRWGRATGQAAVLERYVVVVNQLGYLGIYDGQQELISLMCYLWPVKHLG